MVFATDFDPAEFDAVGQAKRQQSNASASSSATQSSRKVNIASISPAKQTQHLMAQAAQGHAQAKAQVELQEAANETEEAIAAFKRDADYTKQLDNVLSLNADSAVKKTDANGQPVSLPRKPTLPLWLSVLNRVQQGSTVLTGLLMTGALALYGSTVYVDRATNTALTQLDSLQGESQELTAANEAIKQSLAEQASREDSGLKLYESGDVLFVEPAPLRDAEPLPEAATEEKLIPLGY